MTIGYSGRFGKMQRFIATLAVVTATLLGHRWRAIMQSAGHPLPQERPSMGETTTLSIEVSTTTAERLDQLARTTNRSTAKLAQEALDQFLEVEASHASAIAEAIAEADAGGPFIAHEDMVTYLEALARGEDPPPPPTFMRTPE